MRRGEPCLLLAVRNGIALASSSPDGSSLRASSPSAPDGFDYRYSGFGWSNRHPASHIDRWLP